MDGNKNQIKLNITFLFLIFLSIERLVLRIREREIKFIDTILLIQLSNDTVMCSFPIKS